METRKANVAIHVDTTDLNELISQLRLLYTQDKFNTIMYRVLTRAATRTKTIVRKEVPTDYMAKPSWIGSAFRSPIITRGANMSCTIPLNASRGYIGKGSTFPATAANGGRNLRTAYEGRKGKRKRRKYTISAQIVASGASKLPSSGKQPHFMVFSGKKYRGRVFARLDKRGDKIRPAVGIGVPQMPMNRTKDAVQKGVMETLKNRIEHEHAWEMRKMVGKWMR